MMEKTPEQRIVELAEVRMAMIRSASRNESMHPATKVDLNDFYNFCTGCLAAVRQLQTFKQATITEKLWAEINTFSSNAVLLREEVAKMDLSYQKDAALVKCLGRLINKGDTVLREIRSKCNSEMLKTFGEDWMNETNEKYGKDLQIVIKDLSPCVSYSTAKQNERSKLASKVSTNQPATNTGAQPASQTNTGSGGQPAPTYSYGGVPATGTSVYDITTPPPAIAGAPNNEKHITFISPQPDNVKPEKVGLAAIPHFRGHNYINMPQFTGVPEHSLPIFQKEMPPLHTTPDAENFLVAPQFPPP